MTSPSTQIMPRRDADVILEAVAAFRDVEIVALKSHSRAPALVWPRHEAAWFLRHATPLSFKQIGHTLGGRDHASILNGIARVERRRTEDTGYTGELERLRAFISVYEPIVRPASGLARRFMLSDESPRIEDARRLATVLLAAASVLRSGDLTDAEARIAALALLKDCTQEAAHG